MNVSGDLPSDTDRVVIKNQISAEKVDTYSIPVRCQFGFPVLVIQKINCSGEVNNTNLANPIWLTCPYLNEKIHALEGEGYISKITSFMRHDRIMMTHMHDAHAEFYFFRKELYNRQFNSAYPEHLTDRFNLGIGGIHDIQHIKCLHLHFGHYLICKKNKAGFMTKLLLNKIHCDNGRCTCLTS